jgi:hypothetical protein
MMSELIKQSGAEPRGPFVHPGVTLARAVELR